MKKSTPKKKGKPAKKKTLTSRWSEGFAQKKPILKFISLFALGILLFYVIYFSDFFTEHILNHIANGQAKLSSFLLNIFGFGTDVSTSIVSNGKVVLDIKKGCDGIEPTFFFLMGVLLVPFSKKAKLVGLLVGLVVLSLLNILRIIGLFLVSSYWPDAFDFLHLHGGFTLFFIVTIIVWIFWANWAIGLPKTPSYEKSVS
ncbi:MAG: archaeosortase/exosortase family protein [Saprospiraceae bacterium]|nr:archaeosortase/exosortase family protein [Lewinella sp.]